MTDAKIEFIDCKFAPDGCFSPQACFDAQACTGGTDASKALPLTPISGLHRDGPATAADETGSSYLSLPPRFSASRPGFLRDREKGGAEVPCACCKGEPEPGRIETDNNGPIVNCPLCNPEKR